MKQHAVRLSESRHLVAQTDTYLEVAEEHLSLGLEHLSALVHSVQSLVVLDRIVNVHADVLHTCITTLGYEANMLICYDGKGRGTTHQHVWSVGAASTARQSW